MTSACRLQTAISRRLSAAAGLLTLLAVFLSCPVPLAAANLEEMSLDRWKKLRETERYQLQIAEKYYREKKWKVALAEYEKFLTLYERSEAAPYSQLKWSLCQLKQRKLNTAIKEGFQSVVDYWPESPDAIAAGYYIANTYKNMGEVKKAKSAYRVVLDKHPKHLVSVYALVDLIDISKIEDDPDSRVEYWETLTYKKSRVRESRRICENASRSLAVFDFTRSAFDSGVKALATTYNEQQLVPQVVGHVRRPIGSLTGDSKTKARGEKLADRAIGFVRTNTPTDRSTPEKKQAAKQFFYLVADLQASARRNAKVIEEYKQIRKLFGTDDVTLARLGSWHKSQGRFDDARKAYTQFENKVEGQNQIAVSYRDQRNYEAAVLAYRRNVSLDPENIIRWNGEIAHTYHYYAHKYNEAIAVYQELLKLDPENTEKWLWQIATAFRSSGKYKEAIGYYRQCTNFPGNYSEMAACHRAIKEYNEAVLLYNQIIGGAPKSAPWALLQVGYTYEQSGQKERAIQMFQQVCKRFPKDGHASQAHAHLQTKYKISVTLGGAKDD